MITMQNTIEIVGRPTRATKLVNKFNAWIDRDGNFYPVHECGHISWVAEFTVADYSDLEDSGWIHLTNGKPVYAPSNDRMKISHQQRATLEAWDTQQHDRVHVWDSYVNSLLDCGTLEDA